MKSLITSHPSAIIFSISILGLYLGEIFIYGSAVPILIGGYYFIRSKDHRIQIQHSIARHGIFLGLLGIMLLLWLYSAMTGINPEASVEKFIDICLVIGGFLLLYYLLLPIYDDYLLQKLGKILAIFLPLISILILFEASELSPGFNHWLRGAEGNHFLGDVTAPLTAFIPFAWMAYFSWATDKPLLKRGLIWVLPVIFFAAVIAANARSAWIGYIAALITFIILHPSARQSKFEFFVTHVIGAVIGAIGFIMNAGLYAAKYRMGGANNLDDISTGRLAIWDYSIGQWAEHPIFGIGVRGYRYLPFDGVELNSYLHPHNIFVQIGLETGWAGLIAFLTMIGYLAYCYLTRIWANDDLRRQTAGPAAGVVGFCIASLTWTSIFYTWWMIVGLLPVVFTAWQLRTKNHHA
jgi:O-antigen ligase